MIDTNADMEWGLVLGALEIEHGTPVAVRSEGTGAVVGRIQVAAGSMVGLAPAVHLHNWQGCGRGTGSLYDLIAHPEASVERSESCARQIVRDVCDVTPISEERYAHFLSAPRAR